MTILSIDFGAKRIGLAKWNSAANVVLPCGIVESAERLVELIKAGSFEKIIIGLPVSLNGMENENTRRVRNFAAKLRQKISLPIEFIDERFSSQAADRMGAEGASRDEKAAMILLQGYLENNN